MTDRLHEGVWLSTVPQDANYGAQRTDLLEVDIPEEDVAPYEWIEAGHAVPLDGLTRFDTTCQSVPDAQRLVDQAVQQAGHTCADACGHSWQVWM